MLKKSKKKISPVRLKLMSTFAVGVIMMLVVFTLTSILMKNALKVEEERYRENCSHVLQGYSSAIKYYLENYHTSLASIYNDELFEKGDMQKIQDWIQENLIFINEDFFSVFYVDNKGTGYFSNGEVIDLSEKSYIKEADFTGNNYYVSDLVFAEGSDSPAFVSQMPFYDSKERLQGRLCAAVSLDKLEKISSSIKIGEHSSVSIIDRKGKFIVHEQKEFVGKTYIPKNEKFQNITSIAITKLDKNIVETENVLGVLVDLYSSKIENTGWTLCVAFPKEYFSAIYKKIDFIGFMIIVVATAALGLLLFIDNCISDYFYKNQLIVAVYDQLTNLWTRRKFEIEAEKMINKSPSSKYMLLEGDIRGFKFINQNYGEDEADGMIVFYSSLLNHFVKENHGLIGHGYADHFYIMFKIQNVHEAMNIFKGSQYLLSEMVKEYKIPFFPKFGITFCKPSRHRGITVKELIGQASFAKSMLKDSMLQSYSIYNARLLDKANEERTIEQSMKSALESQEFFVMYQPKISLSNEKIVGAEALVRWKNPELGLLAPAKFIPLFERNGFVTKLDFYVYDKVFQFLDSQLKEGKPVVPVSVNMSRNHDKPEKFMAEFMRIFRNYTIPPYLIQVEIIERSVMDKETLCEITEALHEEGFTVAMDDFGSGESSLNMLTTVPVDVLKFDREFLLSMVKQDGKIEEKTANFIRSLVDLSKNLDKETVFEGVETEKQRDFLRSIKCDQVQGFLYSRPLDEEDFVEFIRNHL